MSTTYAERHYIGGQWVDPTSNQYADVVNPATEQVVGRVAIGSDEDVDRAVRAAAGAFEAYQDWSSAERSAMLGRIADGLAARRAEFGAAITREIGNPASFANGYQVDAALAHFDDARRLLDEYQFEYRLHDDLIRREPFGVCGLITAWNWPVMLITSKLTGALAAGCTVVVKPSELSPSCGTLLAEVIDAADVPEGIFNLVHGDGAGVGQAISKHTAVDLISFTGSTRAGIAISKAAADSVKSVHLELGGKSANIILPDADFETAIPDAVQRAFINSGQSCIAPTRLLVQREQVDEVVGLARRIAQEMVVGDPLAEGTTFGPSANAPQYRRVQAMIRDGIEAGATLVCGGPGLPDGIERGYFNKPTIFSDVTPEMRIAQEEIFGPVLSVMTYRDEEDAVRIANDTTYGLAGYVSSGDPEKAARVAARLKAGRIFVNGARVTTSAPFGGYKRSGLGREWGVFGLETFLEVKAVLGQPSSL
jgi:acyl-CoA reductase-like NAD-dependent aldehyde dehydrogenase